ncbi:MAG: BrnT family toxin, partial [Chthoniobacterales bacterium]
PFSIRLLPDEDESRETRFFSLGKSVNGRALFNVFWTDGKLYRVILSRDMTPEELGFYERKNSEAGNG